MESVCAWRISLATCSAWPDSSTVFGDKRGATKNPRMATKNSTTPSSTNVNPQRPKKKGGRPSAARPCTCTLLREVCGRRSALGPVKYEAGDRRVRAHCVRIGESTLRRGRRVGDEEGAGCGAK